jgi:hypothetical protein
MSIARAVVRRPGRDGVEPHRSNPKSEKPLLEETTMNNVAILIGTAPTDDQNMPTSVMVAPPHRRLRSIGAVFAGLLATVVSTTAIDVVLHATGVFPELGRPMVDALYLLAIAYRLICGAAGGYVAARIAIDRPARHAVALGVIGTIVSTAGVAVAWNRGSEFGPIWYPLALVATAIPCALAGGWLRARQLLARARG